MPLGALLPAPAVAGGHALRCHVVSAERAAPLDVAPPPPSVVVRPIEPVAVEGGADTDRPRVLVRLRVTNVSSTVRVLRWDLAHAPRLRLGGHAAHDSAAIVEPLGQRLPGMSPGALAVGGVLEEELPPHSHVDLFTVFGVASIPRGSLIALDPIDTAPLHAP